MSSITIDQNQYQACLQPSRDTTPCNYVDKYQLGETYIEGPAEIPEDFAKQLWVEALAWGICP